MSNYKYVYLPQRSPGPSSLYRVPNSFLDTPDDLYDSEPIIGNTSTRGAPDYGYLKPPVASYGPIFTYNTEGLSPEDSYELVDEGIPSDEDSSFVSTLNINSSLTQYDGSGVWKTGNFNYLEAQAALADFCPNFGAIYWNADQGTSSEGNIYYLQPFLYNFSEYKVTVSAREDNDKGWYHQLRNVAVFKDNGEQIGFSENSGELSLTYNDFEFSITLSIPESSVYDYFLSASPSVLIKVEYLNTKDSGDPPDQGVISSVQFSMTGHIYDVHYTGSSGVDPIPSGDIVNNSQEQGTTFFKLLMGDK